MKRRAELRRFDRLIAAQRLACERERAELGRACAERDRLDEIETRALEDLDTAAARMEAVFSAPRLCPDGLTLANRILQSQEAALTEIRQSTSAAREVEDRARAGLFEREYRLRLVGDMARAIRRKQAEARDGKATSETLSARLATEGRP